MGNFSPAPRTLRVLLVDDYDVNRQIIRVFMNKIDCQIEEVASGEQALEKFKKQPFDLVLMDIEMSGMNGYRTTEAIRAWEAENGKRPVPIVALTSHGYDEDIKKSRDAGCTVHLCKPIESRTLLEAIADLTGRPQVTVEAALEHLIPRFMEDMIESCRSIGDALPKGDLEAIRVTCHRMKGASGMFGFRELSEISKSLETAAKTGDRAETERLSAKLARHLAEVKIDFVG